MKSMNATRVLLAVAFSFALAGCSKTSLTNLWKSPEPSPLQTILVINLDRNMDMRRMWEDALVAEFQANGVNARPEYSVFPTSLPDSQQVVTVAHRDGYDGVVVAHALTASHTGKFDNDYAKTAPGGSDTYWRGWYHTHFMQAMTAAPLKDDDTRFQIDVANAAGQGTLLWTGSTTPVKPTDTEKIQVEVCGELVSELMRQGLVAKRK
jgi:hypothetical protein